MANEKGPAIAGKFKYENVSPRSEEEILSFWKENKIFEKSVERRKPSSAKASNGIKNFVFYEGPQTANGTPGVHHVEARSFKDIILRYKTMCGFHVPRRAGWDTHGLPVEVEVEKKLGLKSKKDIEAYGVAEFNKKCKESVWEYKELWECLTDRMGFWIDMKNEALYPREDAKEKGYKVIAANFVSTEDGSGIVHIAPAFGENDFQASKTYDLPVIITTEADGLMRTPGFAWDRNWFKKADPQIIEDLNKRELLFKKEKYEHDYPFCWRCKTPLMYFARKTWWVDVNAVREKLIKNNQKINWHPVHLKDGRMGEWLKEKKNWAFSRERYWGTPLPVWRCIECEKINVAGSLEELDASDPSPTNLILMRHGEAIHNVKGLATIDPKDDKDDVLTEAGKRAIEETAKKLKKEKIDIIISSPS